MRAGQAHGRESWSLRGEGIDLPDTFNVAEVLHHCSGFGASISGKATRLDQRRGNGCSGSLHRRHITQDRMDTKKKVSSHSAPKSPELAGVANRAHGDHTLLGVEDKFKGGLIWRSAWTLNTSKRFFPGLWVVRGLLAVRHALQKQTSISSSLGTKSRTHH